MWTREYHESTLLFVLSHCHVQPFVSPWTAACQASLSSLSPGICSISCPLNWWCHLTISFSALLPFSFCFQSFPESSQELALCIMWPKYWSFSFSFSTSSSNEYSVLVPLRLIDLISLQSKGLSRVFSSITIWKHQLFSAQSSLWSNSHIHTWLPERS